MTLLNCSAPSHWKNSESAVNIAAVWRPCTRACCSAALFSERTRSWLKAPKAIAASPVGSLSGVASAAAFLQTPTPSAISNTSRMRAPEVCQEIHSTTQAAMARTSRCVLICQRYDRPAAVSSRLWRQCILGPENQCCGGYRRTTWDTSSVARPAGVKFIRDWVCSAHRRPSGYAGHALPTASWLRHA